jgi:hypothetical protein
MRLVTGPPRDHEQRWRGWLKTIDQDITTVFYWRATWLAIGEMLRANPAIPPSHVFNYLSNTYGTSQAVAVRRLADPRRGVVSLAALIKDVRKLAVEITVERWAGLYPGSDVADFARFQAVGTSHFDPSIAKADLVRLSDAVEHVKTYVDEHLAHRDPNPTRDIPTFGQIHSAIDLVAELFRKYNMVVTGVDRVVMVPVPKPGWFLPFTVPWLPPGAKAPEIGGTIRSLTR